MKNLKPIKGYEGQYFAHPDGYIYSAEQITTNGRRIRGRILKATKRADGYHTLVLYKNGVRKQYLLHRLLAEVFLEDFSEELQVNHKDLDKSNNGIDNLEMVTPKENSCHARDNGHFPKTNVKDYEVVSKIRELLELGVQQKEIAEQLGVSTSTVCRINKNRSYAFYD